MAFSVLSCKKCFKVGVVLISIKFKTLCQYFLNPKMEIPTTRKILLRTIMICAIVLLFGAMYVIALFVYSFLCVSNICSDYFRKKSV